MDLFRRCSLFFPVILFLLGTLSARAQNTVSSERNVLRGSNRALSFSLDGLSLGSIDGGVGGKWWIAPGTALRTSLNFNVSSDEDVTGNEIDAGRSAISAGLSFLVEWHSIQVGRVSPYLSSGFSVGVGAFSETTDFALDNPLRQRRFKGSNLDLSVSAGLGAEVFVSRRVSFAGEHLIAARVRTGSEQRREFFRDAAAVVTDRDIRNFDVGLGTSSLIVSVYF